MSTALRLGFALAMLLPVTGCGGDRTSAPPAAGPLRYALVEGEARQSLEVESAGEGRLRVAVARQAGCARRETGTAVQTQIDADPEVEVDTDGEAHAAEAFQLEPRPGCTISIRLEIGDRSRAWVREAGCESACPLSDAMMRRE